MENISEICLNYKETLINALKNLEKHNSQIVLVIDDKGKLIGTISDGDIRRNLIIGISLETQVSEIMNKNFVSVHKDLRKHLILDIMKKKEINQIPVIDKDGKVTDIILLRELIKTTKKHNNPVLIMAGGIGSRLMPFTENCPKPMLKVGEKPILEILIEQLIENGFSNFYISVNYLKEQIIKYFNDGSKWNVNIKYLKEKKRLGTAGSLSLLPKDLKESFIVINGDILTKFNLYQLLDFHKKNHSFATICAREYEFKVPFGVIESNGIELNQIVEKPTYKSYVNAGVYTFEPEVLNLIKSNESIDMPELIERMKNLKKKINVCPIHEFWIDIGRHETLNKAHKKWNK